MPYSQRKNRSYSSHQWLRQEFAEDLLFIWDESAWLTKCELGSKNWRQYADMVQNHGQLGDVYPRNKYGVEGDTPSFLHILPNGLHDAEHPEQVGWGGCFTRAMCADSLTTAWTNWQQPQKSISRQYEEYFYSDIFHDFAARMEWAHTGVGNINPVVIVNGKKGISPIRIKAQSGKPITLDASCSYDPEGHTLTYRWWTQPDAGTYGKTLEIPEHRTRISLNIPDDAGGKEIHIVCEVRDNGKIPLVSYRRIIVAVD